MQFKKRNNIELINVSKKDNIYSSTIKHTISNERLRLKFGIEPSEYIRLKRILEFRPFEHTGVAPYQYFFMVSTLNLINKEGLGPITVRVEQLRNQKQFTFKVGKKYYANLLWFLSLNDKSDVKHLLEN